MADAKLSVTGAKPGMKKLDAAQAVLKGMESHTMVCVQVFLLMKIAPIQSLTKSHLIVNRKRIGKSKGVEASLEVKKKEITPKNQETPKNVPKKKYQNHANKATVEIITMENGEKLIVGVTNTMASLVTRLLASSQKNGAKENKEKADGFQKSSEMMEKSNSKIVSKNQHTSTRNLHAAKRASDHTARRV